MKKYTTLEIECLDTMSLASRQILALTSVIQGLGSQCLIDQEGKDYLLDLITDNLSEIAGRLCSVEVGDSE